MAKPTYDVKNLMISGNTISILGVIGSDWWEESNTSNSFLREFKALEKKHDTIIVEINSPGGSLYHGQPIYNAIRNSKKKTITRVVGIAASMAGIIAIAGDEVECFDNAMIMLHAPMNFLQGNAEEFRTNADLLDKFADTLITSVAKKIGKTTDETKDLYFDYKDHFLTAAEAKEAGLINTIIDEAATLPDNVEDMSMDQIIAYYEEQFKPQSKNSPIKNFFNNLTKPTDMKIDQLILDSLNLEKGVDVQAVVDAIKAQKTELTEAQAAQQTTQDELATATAKAESTAAELATANESLTASTANLGKITDVLDTIDESIKKAESVEDKLAAFTTFTDEDETHQFAARDKNGGKAIPSYVQDAVNFLG